MAEVHVIGELVGGSDFPSGDLFCRWGLSHGSGWRVLEGLSEGQTQIDHPQVWRRVQRWPPRRVASNACITGYCYLHCVWPNALQ